MTFTPVPRCPAADPLYETPHGTGVRCAIECNTLTAGTDPSSLMVFCFDRYDLCSSWESEKRRIEEGRRADAQEAEDEAIRAKMREMRELDSEVEVTHFS